MKKVVLLIAAFAFAVTVNAQDKASQAVSPTSPATSAPAVQENPNAGEFKFDVETYDFGTIKQGESVTYDFNFSNTGKEPLIISEAHGSCGCTVPVWPKEPLKKGDKGQIKVTFNSAGKQGMQDKTITITSNASDSPKVLHIKGTVEAVVVTPESKPTETPKN